MCNVSGMLYSNSDNISLCCLGYDQQSSHTSVIRANYVFLWETLDVKFSGLVALLYLDHVVSAVERDDITAEKTSFRANEKLLSALSHKSPQQFQLFLDALDNCGQQHVRNVIAEPQGLLIHIAHFTHIQKRCVKVLHTEEEFLLILSFLITLFHTIL